VHVADVFPIELTVYAPNELRQRPRSSTDGKPIVRIRESVLRTICEREHPELWRRYLADGSTPSIEDILAAEEAGDEASDRAEDLPVYDGDEMPTFDPVESGGPDESNEDPEDEEEREPRIRRPDRARRHGRIAPDSRPDDR
jgi:hypothetical protein